MTPEIVSSPAPLEPGATAGFDRAAGLDRAAARSAFAAASGPFTLRPRNSERAPGDPTALAAALLQERHVTLELQRAILPLHEAQLLTYLRLSRYRVGLLLNFNTRALKDGIRRRVL